MAILASCASHKHFKNFEHLCLEGDPTSRVGTRSLIAACTLPHGGQRKLELGIILAADPEVLLLDEPTAGMAAEQALN